MEPPSWTEAQARVVPGQRRQFAAVGGFVQGEQDDPQPGFVAEAVQQRFQPGHVARARRDVRPAVAAEPLEHLEIVVAPGTRMNLHDHAVG